MEKRDLSQTGSFIGHASKFPRNFLVTTTITTIILIIIIATILFIIALKKIFILLCY